MTKTQVMFNAEPTILTGRPPTERAAGVLQTAVLVSTDLLIVGASTVTAVNGRQVVRLFGNPGVDVDNLVRPLGVAIAALWLISLALSGSYSPKILGVGTVEYRRLLSASLGTMGALGIGAYLFDYPLSRAFYFLLFVVGIPGLLFGRLVLRRFIHALRNSGRLQTQPRSADLVL